MGDASHLWGIDLGGTKIEGVVLDQNNLKKPLLRLRVPTEGEKGYAHIVQQVARLIKMMEDQLGYRPDRVGIGTPGTTDPDSGLMKNSNTTCLNGMPFHKDLEAALRMKVHMANDANCFALAETLLGVVPDKVPDALVVFGVIMGSGVGGGLVVNGRVINGRHGIGGEWGHNFLDESGGPCYCGKHGCVENVISGKSLERYYFEISGKRHLLKDIVAMHRAGTDSYATATIERLLEQFARGLSAIINIIDPDAVVLGGGVGNIDELYTEGIKRLEKYIFNHRLDTQILKPSLGDSAGVFGAAMLARD